LKRNTLKLLMLLRSYGDAGRAAWRIARELEIPRKRVADEIAALEAEGFPVRHLSPKRWALAPGGPLVAEEIRHELGTQDLGRRIIVLDETTSTQDAAKREAARTSRSGTVIFAERQTRGRGRFHREWTSSPGDDLTFSAVLRAPQHELNPSLVTVTASVAVCETIVEVLNLPARIKWPNDIILADGKVAGILCERTQPRKQPPAYVLGVGINVNGSPPLDTATSLGEVLGDRVDRLHLARELLRSLDAWFEEVRRGHTDLIGNHWRRLSSTLGTRVTLVRGKHKYTGRVVDIDHDLGLTLQLDDGLTTTFRGEQVTMQQ
jgi:BirA family biotin operon repressor/biotin-[acetyl-CoA-carboxylase] ligase